MTHTPDPLRPGRQVDAVEDVGMMRAGNETRKGDWMECSSGQRFYPLDPRPEEVLLSDIAHHLARINRYNGAIAVEQYSVAEHATAIAWWLWFKTENAMIALQGLHHDDPEAYIGDMVRPLKRNMPAFTEAERPIHVACMDRFGLPHELHYLVKECDNRILVDERAQVMSPSQNTWGIDHLEPLGVRLLGLRPACAESRFLTAHAFLDGQRAVAA